MPHLNYNATAGACPEGDFSVTLEKTGICGSIGLQIRYHENEIIIHEVREKGLVSMWNEKHSDDMKVMVGDKLVSLNDCSGSSEDEFLQIMQLFGKCNKLSITIRRGLWNRDRHAIEEAPARKKVVMMKPHPTIDAATHDATFAFLPFLNEEADKNEIVQFGLTEGEVMSELMRPCGCFCDEA